jgi:hypothetical protein
MVLRLAMPRLRTSWPESEPTKLLQHQALGLGRISRPSDFQSQNNIIKSI